MSGNEFRRNAILAQLPDAEFAALRPHLTLERSEIKRPAYEPGKPIADIYFPLTSVYSLVAVTDGRIALEVATIGYEGMVGLPVYLGATSSPKRPFVRFRATPYASVSVISVRRWVATACCMRC
jgi:hypothetical protein